MADERHIIDIILKARDDTGGALASAAAKLGLLKDQQRAVQEAADKTGRSFDEMSNKIRTSAARLTEEQKKLGDSTGRTLDAQVALEQASKNYVKTLNDTSASEAQRTQSLAKLQQAQKGLALSITQLRDEEAKAADAASKASAKRLQEAAVEVERLKALRALRSEAIKEQARQDAERVKAHADLMRTLDASDRESAQRRKKLREEDLKEILDKEKKEQQAAAETARRRQELLRTLDAAERDSAQRRRAWRDEELRQILEREKAQQKAAEETAKKRQELNSIINRSEREAEARRIANADRELRMIQQMERARRDASMRQQAERERELNLGREYVKQINEVQRIEAERRKAATGGDFAQRTTLEFDAQEARAKAAALAAELKTLFANIEANVDLDDAGFKAHAAEVMAMKELLDNDIEIDVDIDVGNLDRVRAMASVVNDVGDNANKSGRQMGFLGGMLRSVGEGFEGGSSRIASFDNYLRGLLSLGIALFFNQLFLLAGAAAGALAALASSAAMAGAAIGGALTAGIMQAIPVLGVFATALSRVAAITDAVQQANLLQQQQSYAGATAARTQANAQDAVVAASERVRDANERIVEAQKEVNDARQAGIDKLKELILEERGLSLTVEETEAAIRRQAAAGDTSAIPRSLLRRDEARQQLGAVQGQIQQRRKQAASGEGSPELQEAKEQLEDAVQAGKQAERALQQSKRSAAEAAESVSAAQGKLAFLLAGLSASERRLYEAIIRLQTVWRGFSQEVAAPLIDSFTFAVDRVIVLLQDPAIKAAFTGLSSEMADQFRRIFSAFTNREGVGQILRFVEQARQNLKPLTDIIINISKAFMDIGEAAGPALSKIIRWVRDITGNIRDFFESGRKSGELTDFFSKGVTHLKAWGDLLWEIIRLFGAIAGPGGGARNGLKLVRDMAEAIGGWADEIGKTGSKTNDFFQRFFDLSRKMLGAMSPVFEAIAKEIDKTFNKDGLRSVQGFATFLADILIPALGDFARFIGRGTAALGEFTKQHPLFARIVSSILAASLAFGVLSKLASVFSPILTPLRFLVTYLLNATVAGRVLMVLFRALGAVLLGPWGLVAGAIVLVLAKLGLLDDLARAFGKFFSGIWKEIEGPVKRATATFKKLFDAVGEGNGVFAVLRPILKGIITVLGVLFEGLGRSIGRVLGGAIDVISGFVEVLVSLLSGDFRGAWEGAKRILGGFKRVVTGMFTGLGETIYDALSGGFGKVWRFFKNLPDRLWEFIKGIPGKLGEAFSDLGGAILQNITGGVSGGSISDFGKAIVNGIIGLVESAINSVDEIGPINVPDVHLPRLAKGGPIGSGYGGGDRVRILAEAGEHMLTKDEVRNAGGHSAIFALRRLLGGGKQAGGNAFAEGGAVGGAARLGLTISGDLGSFAAQWSAMWERVVAIGQGGVVAVNRLFSSMAARTNNVMERMERMMRRTWVGMIDSTEKRGDRLSRLFRTIFGEVSDVVFKGLRYVSNSTNTVLKALDAEPIKLSLNAPRKAAGGPVGNWGERGRDNVLTYLGRGEAVLNWGQQSLVNALLPGQATLQSLLASSYGYHAGGPGSAPGLATGGGEIVSVPGFPGEMAARKILDEIAYYTKRFGLILTDAFGPGHKSPGHTVYGTAADLAGSDVAMDRAVQALVKAGYKVLYDGRFGSISWPGHGPSTVAGDNAHLHVEFGDKSANLPGGDISIKRAKVEGPDGPLRAIAQALIDRVRDKANAMLESMLVTTDSEGYEYFDVEGGLPVAKTIYEVWQKMNLPFKALLSAIETGIVESGLKNLPGGDQDSVGWRQERDHYGSQEERMNVAHGAQRFFNEWKQFADAGESAGTIAAQVQRPRADLVGKYDQAQGSALKVISGLGVKAPDQFAEGGEISGGSHGEPVSIIGHVGEWVVNQSQQSALAGLLGTSVGKLRDLLGFTGGPTSFQGGGPLQGRAGEKGRYIAPVVDPRSLDLITDNIEKVFDAIKNISSKGKLGPRINKFYKAIRNLTDEGGGLEQMGAALERLGARLETGLALAQAGLRRVGGKLVERAKGMLTSPQRIATITIRNLDKIFEGLEDQRRTAERGLRATDRRIEALRKGGIKKGERDEFTKLMSARNAFLNSIADTDQKIADNRAERYQAQIDRFEANLADAERTAELESRGVDFSERRLAIDEKIGGDRLGFANRRIGISDQRTTALTNESAMLSTFLKRATALGDTDAINDLNDRLAENALLLEEEVATRKELVLAYRQTATDVITGRQDRGVGLIGTASGLIQKIGEISGNLNIDQIKGFLAQTAKVLSDEAKNIASNVTSAVGENLFSGGADNVLTKLTAAFSGGPESFATALGALGPEIASLESTMSETERTAFQALIQSMIDNTTAVVDNTQATNELTDTAVQQWSSTAWQWFREAVFTGMGTVLPEYDVPQMATGGHVTRGGLFKLHTGEFVVNSERSNVPEGDTNIHIHEAGRPLDVTHLASRLAFEKKSRRR